MATAVVDRITSSSSGTHYEIRRGSDSLLYCYNADTGRACQGWLSKKNSLRKQGKEGREPAACKHVTAYVERTGASYGIPFEKKAEKPTDKPGGKSGSKGKAPAAPKPSGVPVLQTTPAPKNWKERFLAEQKAAEARGIHTPAAMLAEFKAEIGRFANLDVEEGEIAVPAAGGARALDVEED